MALATANSRTTHADKLEAVFQQLCRHLENQDQSSKLNSAELKIKIDSFSKNDQRRSFIANDLDLILKYLEEKQYGEYSSEIKNLINQKIESCKVFFKNPDLQLNLWDKVSELFHGLEFYAELSHSVVNILLVKPWLNTHFELLKSCATGEGLKFLEDFAKFANIALEMQPDKNYIHSTLGYYKKLSARIFKDELLDLTTIDGLNLISFAENSELPKWLESQSRQVMQKYQDASLTSKLSICHAAIKNIRELALEANCSEAETKQIIDSLLSRTISCLCFDAPENQEHERLRKQSITAVSKIANLLAFYEDEKYSRKFNLEQWQSDLFASIQNAEDYIQSLSSSMGLASAVIEQYDDQLYLPDHLLVELEKLQKERVVPKDKSAGLRGINTKEELKEWHAKRNATFLMIRPKGEVIASLIMIRDRDQFPDYVETFLAENPQHDLENLAYCSLIISKKISNQVINNNTLEVLFDTMKNICFSYNKNSILGWCRSDQPAMLSYARLGAEIISEPRTIHDGMEYQAIFLKLDLTRDLLREWNTVNSIDDAFKILRNRSTNLSFG